MTVENTNNKMSPQQMGDSYDYVFNFAVLLADPTEEAAKAGIKATVELSDGNTIELNYGSSDDDGYEVTLNSTGIGGKITVNNKRTNSDYITVYRKYALTQEADFQDFNAAPADTTEQCFDKVLMIAQQLQEESERAIKTSITSASTDLSLPAPVAGRTLKWNDEETGLVNSDVSIDEIGGYVETAKENSQIALEQAAIAQDSASQCNEALADCITQTEKAKFYAQESGGKGMPTDICKKLNIEYDTENRKVKLKWKDPNDTYNTLGQVMASWKGTIITYNIDSYPTDYDDGTIILDSTVRNQYQNTEFEYEVPSDVNDITTLKFRAFPYSVNDVYNKDNRNCFDRTIIYEFLYDSNNSNVSGAISYPEGCANEYFTPLGMDYDNDIFDYAGWKDSFIMDLAIPVMLYNKNANNIGLNITGDLGNETGELTGFTTAIYGDINYIPENVDEIDDFEIVADFNTGSSITTTQQTIYGNSTTNAHSPQLAIISKYLEWDMPSSSFSYIGAMTSSNELETDTHYVTKLNYSKSDATLTAYLSTNDGAFVQISQLSVSSIGWDEVMRLGLDLKANPFGGVVNIKGCYIEVNGEKVFDGSQYECLNGQIMEYLNPNDYTVTVDGEDSHVADTTCNANAMVQWKPFWIKGEEYEPKKFHFWVANKKVNKDYKCWFPYDKYGEFQDYYYTSMFDGCVVDSIVRSLSGQTINKSTAGTTQITYAETNGDRWSIEEASFILAQQILLLLLGKSTDTQTVYGTGRYSGGSSSSNNQLSTGQLNKKGQFWGGDSNEAVKVFHKENPWGNIWKSMYGLIQSGGKLYLKLTPNTNDGTTVEEYQQTSIDGYLDTGITLSGTSGGYISGVTLVEGFALLPATVSGSSSTYVPDGCWWDTSVYGFARFGSVPADGLLVGAFALIVINVASYSSWNYGVSLSYK